MFFIVPKVRPSPRTPVPSIFKTGIEFYVSGAGTQREQESNTQPFPTKFFFKAASACSGPSPTGGGKFGGPVPKFQGFCPVQRNRRRAAEHTVGGLASIRKREKSSSPPALAPLAHRLGYILSLGLSSCDIGPYHRFGFHGPTTRTDAWPQKKSAFSYFSAPNFGATRRRHLRQGRCKVPPAADKDGQRPFRGGPGKRGNFEYTQWGLHGHVLTATAYPEIQLSRSPGSCKLRPTTFHAFQSGAAFQRPRQSKFLGLSSGPVLLPEIQPGPHPHPP
jgi:hypothetical protein